MGEVIRGRFPGAEVDPGYLDAFRWTPQLLDDYAAKARALACPRGRLPRWPRGRCLLCRKPAHLRVRLGHRLLCGRCAGQRLRVLRDVAEVESHPSPAPVGSVSEGWEAYRNLAHLPWTAEQAEAKQARKRRGKR
jgi:hypothetical protein